MTPTRAEAPWRGGPVAAADLRLRPLVPDDAAALAELADDWEVVRWTARLPHPYTRADAEAVITAMERARAAGTEVIFGIERLADKQLIGCCGFLSDKGVPQIGYWLGRPYWGKGYGTQAVRRLVRLLFEELEVPRLTVEVMVGNSASARVLEKAGFTFFGTSIGRLGRCAGREMRCFMLERSAWEAAEEEKPRLLVAAVAMVDVDGRVLIAKRPEGKSMAGLWEFPGGKVRDDETPEAALVRELHEELAVDITESCLAPLTFASHGYDEFHLLMPLYLCRVWQGTPTPLEGQELKWLRPADMKDLPMPPADVPLVAILRDWL